MIVSFKFSSLVLLTTAASSWASSSAAYAPTRVACPDQPLLRVFTSANQTLDPREEEYIQARSRTLSAAWHSWIDAETLGYDLDSLGGEGGINFPIVGLGVSGGGYRSALYGAAVIAALDSRNETAAQAGTGGLLQVTSYLAGVSGGAWVVSSLILNSLPMVRDLVLGPEDSGTAGWLVDANVLVPASADFPSSGLNASNITDLNSAYLTDLLSGIAAKAEAGFNVSITDAWSRALSYHFFPGTNLQNFFGNSTHGAGILWSSIQDLAIFKSHGLPYPLLTAESIFANQTGLLRVPLGNPVYEFTPFEMGSWDPALSAFADIKFAGTRFQGGKPVDPDTCVNGFDQAGFIFGTSASLFNGIVNTTTGTISGLSDTPETEAALKALLGTLGSLSKGVIDVANWPNAFKGIKPGTYPDSDVDNLRLIDGESAEENLPLGPLLAKVRGLDVIVALDASGDNPNTTFPEGNSLYTTLNRTTTVLHGVSQPLPPLPPSPTDLVKLGLNLHPTFFGCYPTQSPPEFPLLLYFPNAPPVNGGAPVTNTPTLQLQYPTQNVSRFFDAAFTNAVSGFVPGALGADPLFGKCLQCAVIDRARFLSEPQVPRSEFCDKCFSQYCYTPGGSQAAPSAAARREDVGASVRGRYMYRPLP